VLILNNAQNPTGKVFTVDEMKQISEILKDYPHIIVISDEVYDFLVFDDVKFVPFASLGDNYSKTVTVWSGGKLFNATGWKCGWAIGPAEIIKQAGLHAYATLYCANTPVQVAISKSLDKTLAPGFKDGMTYEAAICKEFQDVRDLFTEELKKFDLPIKLLPCQSGYFMMMDISECKSSIPEKFKSSHDFEDLKESETGITKNRYFMEDGRVPLDLAFCRWIAVTRGVVMMPCSLFYHQSSLIKDDNYARIAICMGMDTSVKALNRLLSLA
jgi:aspartate/methionine/tyrosine aminotransferase